MLTAVRSQAPRRAAALLWTTALGLVLTAAPALAAETQGGGTGGDDLMGGVILVGVAGVVVGTLVSFSAEVGAGRDDQADRAGH